MAFFDSFPPPPPPPPPPAPEPRPPREPWMRPGSVIPGTVAAELLLVRTETAAVAVGSLRANPNGFEFALHVRTRHEDVRDRRGPGGPLSWSGRRRGEPESDQELRLGILYADGRRTATTGANRPSPAKAKASADELVLHSSGWTGAPRQWDVDFWVHPLPPDGPVTFVVSWLAQGVTETREAVDGAAIGAAARRAVELWPDDPDKSG